MVSWMSKEQVVMCWLGLEARGQAKPSKIGQAKVKPWAWLTLAGDFEANMPWLWAKLSTKFF